jgi:hypothetical protein
MAQPCDIILEYGIFVYSRRETHQVKAQKKHTTNEKATVTPHIDGIDITSDRLTSRGGLALFVKYLRNVDIDPHLDRLFGSIRKNGKGVGVSELFKQLFSFFTDGSSRRLTYFDALQQDEGYAAAIETDVGKMASSHAVKRFFQAFRWPRIFLFRRLLQRLFLWRLRIKTPKIVILNIDTMVMNNDDAKNRHGVKPTYKKIKGFQPLQMTWGRFIIDAVFRGGDKHSNHSDTVEKMVRHVVNLIRKQYDPNIPIIIRLDSGFFDQKLFNLFEKLGIGYICGGRLVGDIVSMVDSMPCESWNRFKSGSSKDNVWEYIELGDRRSSWKRFRRAFFCRPLSEDGQLLLPTLRPGSIIYTNLGMGQVVDQQLATLGLQNQTTPDAVIACYHQRGSDELIHRALKEFGFEQLPFKRFAPNAAFYYTMLTAFFLYEAFKEDVAAPVIGIGAYPTTVRRQLIDIAAKVISHSGKIVLKITSATWTRLRFEKLWNQAASPPKFAWA